MVKDQIVDFLKSFEIERDEFDLHVTLEHVLVHQKDLTAVNYSDSFGSKDLLAFLVRTGWEAIEEDGALVGCLKDKEKVDLGMGGQIRWSYGPFMLMADVDKAYLNFLEMLFDELKRQGMLLVAVGHQPVSRPEDLEIPPVKEYAEIFNKIKDNNRLVDYYKSAATMTVSFEYAHQDNFCKRFQAAQIIQPALAAFFDNAAWINGQANTKPIVNLNNLFSADENLYTIQDVFDDDFGYEDFANFLLESPALVAEGDKTFEDVFTDSVTRQDILRQLSFVKPVISMDEHGLTFTGIDSVPYPLNMAYLTMIKSLLYSADHITALQKMIEERKAENIIASHFETREKGLEAPIGDGNMQELVKELYFMITLTVAPKEQHYLQPLNNLLFKDVTPKKVTARQFANILANE
jgi:glutamate--cysteine ligase